MKITLVLHNIRSTYNVGAILRTCEGLGVKKIIYSGYTPKYNDPSLLPHLREKLNHQIVKSALGTEEGVNQEIVKDLPEWLSKQKSTIFGLENNLAGAERFKRLCIGAFNTYEKLSEIPEGILILGEEVGGIPVEIRKYCDYFLEIPMQGKKESFNVSIAAAIALWELRK